MTDSTNPFRTGSKDIRWDLIERAMGAYRVGCPSDPALAELETLTNEEREALKWEMDRDAANEREIIEMLTGEGIENIAKLGGKPGNA